MMEDGTIAQLRIAEVQVFDDVTDALVRAFTQYIFSGLNVSCSGIGRLPGGLDWVRVGSGVIEAIYGLTQAGYLSFMGLCSRFGRR